jgi:DNA-binding LytR/AlgR family response regulator
MRCIIVDDEPLAREGIELKVKKIEFLELAGMFSGGIAANNFLVENNDIDLIFLDIQMPDLTGLELLRKIKKPPLVILTTAFSEYAIEGFELDVIDYLLKPIDFQKFIKAVNKAREIWDWSNRLKAEQSISQMDYIYIRADRQYIKVFLNEIYYIEGMKNYAMIYTKTGKYITAISLSLIMKQLPTYHFARINKSFIINTQYIERILTDTIILNTGKELPFGKVFHDKFIEKFVDGNLLKRP